MPAVGGINRQQLVLVTQTCASQWNEQWLVSAGRSILNDWVRTQVPPGRSRLSAVSPPVSLKHPETRYSM